MEDESHKLSLSEVNIQFTFIHRTLRRCGKQLRRLLWILNKDYLLLLQEMVEFGPEDVIADIGGGTGWFAQRFWKLGRLREPVLLVEPSGEMLKAEQFFSDSLEKLLTKVFILGALHHFQDPATVFKQMASHLAPGGCCVISFHPPDNGWPTSSAEKNLDMRLTRVDAATTELQLREAGFSWVESKQLTRHHQVTKAQWYKMLRCRYSSTLCHFTDAQIEEGILEIEREKFQSFNDDDIITIDDNLTMITARKGD